MGGSTFLIPPLVRENIEIALKKGPYPGKVLLFDDASITGRTMHDLRAVLSSIGATDIQTAVIVNRSRQPYDGKGKEQLRYYWRLDVPNMGHDGNCPLCHAIHLAESFSGLLSSDKYVKFLKTWILRWIESSPINNWNQGLGPIPLQKVELNKDFCYRKGLKNGNDTDHFTTLDIIRSTGLIAHISELHAMTGRDDYSLKKIRKHSEPEIRIEIAASQLLLFGHEFDMDIRIDLLKTLLIELVRLDHTSQHSSLGFLVILYGMSLIDESMKTKMIESIFDEGWVPHKNLSAKIIVSYFVSEKLITPKSIFYNTGKRFLSTASWTMSELFNNLYREILSSKGNSHSEAIPLLINDLSKTVEIKNERFDATIESAYHLVDILNGIERGWARRRNITRLFDENRKEIKELLPLVESKIKKFQKETINIIVRDNLKHLLSKFLSVIKDMSSAFFHIIPMAESYWENQTFTQKAIPEIIERIKWENASVNKKDENGLNVKFEPRTIKISNNNELRFDENAGEVWIFWCRSVCGIVQDLMHNAVYTIKQIPDPKGFDDTELAHQWIHLSYQKKHVEISFMNFTNKSPNDIYSKLKMERFEPLKKNGGSIMLSDLSKDGLYALKLSLPYVGNLKSDRGEYV